MDNLEEAIRDIEVRTGVRPGFFADLMNEDDWSFIIKSHALLESACAEILAERSGVPDTIDIFSRLELSGRATGKVAFLKVFGLLIDRERRFISALSELRNMLVHNARSTTFSLPSYVAGLDKNQRNSFVESFGYAYLSENDQGKELIASQSKVMTEPKKTIWLSLKYVLGVISVQIESIRLHREAEKLQAEIGARFLPKPSSPRREG